MIDYGTFVHHGRLYDLGLLFALVKERDSFSANVATLRAIEHNTATNGNCGSCKYGPPDWHEQRINESDLSFPILVHTEHLVLDGLHRLEKASRKRLSSLPAIEISDTDLALCLVAGGGKAKMTPLTFGSTFAGIGGFDLAFERAGMQCLWQIEQNKQCQKVLAKHWPNVERHSDVKDCGSHNLTRVDVMTGGFPCQDVSVAGKRAGLAGDRSGLWYEFHRLISEMQPRWVVIENVPGLLSSSAGADLQIILDGLNGLGYNIEVDICDARYFGLAQRRRRVFLVCERLDDGLKRRSEFCSRALSIAITQTLLQGLSALTDQCNEWRNGLISRASVTGLTKTIRFFESSRKPNLWCELPSVLLDALQRSAHDCEKSGCLSELAASESLSADAISSWQRAIGSFAGRIRTDDAERVSSTLKLWQRLLGDPSDELKKSTTSTDSPLTIDQRIYFSAKISLSICEHIVALRICCPYWWQVASLSLTALEEFIEYAGRASENLFVETELRGQYRSFVAQASEVLRTLGCSGKQRASEIFPNRESLRGDSASSVQAGPGIAATIRSRSANRGVNASVRRGEDDLNLVEVAGCLQERDAKGSDSDTKPGHLLVSRLPDDVAGALQSHSERHGHAMTTQQAAESRHLVAMPLKASAGKGTLLCEDKETYVAVVRTDNAGANGIGVLDDGTTHTMGGATDVVVTHALTGEGHDASEDGSQEEVDRG